MRIPVVPCFAVLLACVAACANRGEAEKTRQVDSVDSALFGRVLLPGGYARRGLEVHATVTASDGELLDHWLLFDEEGRFSHTFKGKIASLTVTAGVSAEVYRMDGEELQGINRDSRFELESIDLRDRLTNHRLLVRSADVNLPGEVRVAMWFGPPYVGPNGEPVSLGSRQFPPVTLGVAQEWLVPFEAESIYFLVERPAESESGGEWRSGRQQLFGPFTAAELPTELLIE